MVSDVMFSSDSQEWETPPDLFAKLDKEFGFVLDPAASHQNYKCACYFTKEDDGLTKDWYGVTTGQGSGSVYVNPPYGRGETVKWVRKAVEECDKGALVVMLLPARVDTRWFHDYIEGNPMCEIRFIKGRVKFLNERKEVQNSAPFPSMVVIFRPKTKSDIPQHLRCGMGLGRSNGPA